MVEIKTKIETKPNGTNHMNLINFWLLLGSMRDPQMVVSTYFFIFVDHLDTFIMHAMLFNWIYLSFHRRWIFNDLESHWFVEKYFSFRSHKLWFASHFNNWSQIIHFNRIKWIKKNEQNMTWALKRCVFVEDKNKISWNVWRTPEWGEITMDFQSFFLFVSFFSFN